MAITRAAFLYLEPSSETEEADFAQCSSCRLFAPPGGKGGCLIHGADVEVDAGDSCGLWMPGEPEEDGELQAAVTPEESGLVKSRVQCHRCDYGGEKCRLYVLLNRLPAFDLEEAIHPHGCCNAWTPERASKPKRRYGGRR